jgi:DNA topoisomerase I
VASPQAPVGTTATAGVDAARGAGLRYVSDVVPGIMRRRAGRGYIYSTPDGSRPDPATLERIRGLAIPPAWSDVWISSSANGHIQATGRDARGRKQYIYHPRWREVRDTAKFDRLAAFGEALPRIRAQTGRHIELAGMPREKVLALAVRLLETTLIRVGNEHYARANGSVGLTTMRRRHVRIDGDELRFRFRGKSGVEHRVSVRDRRLARLVKRCQDLPGEELFQYVDEEGEQSAIDSGAINDYLRAIAGDDFTAKDFRTWAGTLLAAEALCAPIDGDEHGPNEAAVTAAVKGVAARLGNTPAVCRSCYIHPAVIGAYLDGSLPRLMARAGRGSGRRHPLERGLLRVLRSAP